jgi:hypothetical protein
VGAAAALAAGVELRQPNIRCEADGPAAARGGGDCLCCCAVTWEMESTAKSPKAHLRSYQLPPAPHR